jgi:tetratricopeptide (TPR) repeat protein
VLRGRDLLARLTRSANAQARGLFERAIELDPGYAPAYVGLGRINLSAVNHGWTQDPNEALQRAENLGRKAIGLDDFNPGAHAVLGRVALHFGDYDRALDELKRAIELNGSDAEAYSGLATVLLYRGDIAGAVAAGELLAQLQPDLSAVDAFNLATAYVLTDRGADAVRILEQAHDRNRALLETNVILAAAYAEVGRQQEAERQAESVRQHFPGFSSEEFGSLLRDASQREKLARALKKAGF